MNELFAHVRDVYWPTLSLLWPSVLLATAVGLSASCVGTFVILRREALLALALPQVVMLGAAIGLRFDFPPLQCALIAAGVALGMAAVAKWKGISESTLPVMYVAGISFAILVVFNTATHLVELQNMITGAADVAVGESESGWTSIILVFIALLCAALWRRWLLISQAPSVAELSGLHPVRWNAYFLIMLGMTIILSTRAMGSTLPTAMIFLPSAAALSLARRIPMALFIAAMFSLVMVISGFIISVENGFPMSHSIAAVGAVVYIVCFIIRRIF